MSTIFVQWWKDGKTRQMTGPMLVWEEGAMKHAFTVLPDTPLYRALGEACVGHEPWVKYWTYRIYGLTDDGYSQALSQVVTNEGDQA